MNLYIKNNEIKEQRTIEIIKDGYRTFNPSHEMLIADGWEVYTPPVAAEEFVEDYYKQRVIKLIRERYSLDDEIAIQRQRYVKPEEFEKYNDYVENCKQQVKEEIGL